MNLARGQTSQSQSELLPIGQDPDRKHVVEPRLELIRKMQEGRAWLLDFSEAREKTPESIERFQFQPEDTGSVKF